MSTVAAAAPHRPRAGRLLRTLSDERLVARVRNGDDAAFEVIYDRYHRDLLSFCRHMLGSREEAEDALQHTCISAYRALHGDDRPIQLKAWLFAIARNRCLTVLRARREHADVDDVEPAVEGLSAEVQRRADLQELVGDLRKLPEEQRAALVLSELGAHSHEEIGVILGVRKEKVKALVFQAREQLIAARSARETDCSEIREQLATLRGGALRRTNLRRHLEACPGCTAYRAEVQRQRAAIAVILPVVPGAALKSSVLGAVFGGGSAGGGGAVAAGLAGGAGAAAVGASGAGGGMFAALGLQGAAAKALAVVAVAGGAGGTGYVAVNELDAPPARSAAAEPERATPAVPQPGAGVAATPAVPPVPAPVAAARTETTAAPTSADRRDAARERAADRRRRGTARRRAAARRKAAAQRRRQAAPPGRAGAPGRANPGRSGARPAPARTAAPNRGGASRVPARSAPSRSKARPTAQRTRPSGAARRTTKPAAARRTGGKAPPAARKRGASTPRSSASSPAPSRAGDGSRGRGGRDGVE